MSGVEVLYRTQRIIVLPNTSTSLVKQGPTGPAGPPGPTGPPGADGTSAAPLPIYDDLADRPEADEVEDKTLFIAVDNQRIYQAQDGVWVQVGGGSASVATLTDVDLSGLTDDDLLGWSEDQGKFVPIGLVGGDPGGGGTSKNYAARMYARGAFR